MGAGEVTAGELRGEVAAEQWPRDSHDDPGQRAECPQRRRVAQRGGQARGDDPRAPDPRPRGGGLGADGRHSAGAKSSARLFMQ